MYLFKIAQRAGLPFRQASPIFRFRTAVAPGVCGSELRAQFLPG
jgi:hypothetical protein